MMRYTRRSSIRLGIAVCITVVFLSGRVATGAEDLDLHRPADTSSPQATLRGFIDSCNKIYRRVGEDQYYDRSSAELRSLGRKVVDCLDTRDLPEYAQTEFAGEVAVCLKEILDRVEISPFEQIPDADSIEAAGGMESLSSYRIPGTRITIARVEEGPQRHEYLFTRGTVARAVEYYEDMKYLPYRTTGPETSEGLHRWYVSAPGDPLVATIVNRLPEWTLDRKFGLTIWKWPGVLFVVLVSALLMVLAYRFQRHFGRLWRGKGLLGYWFSILFPVAAMLVPICGKYVVEHVLTVRATPLYVLSFSANLAAFLAAMVVVLGIGNRIAETIIASPQIHPQGLDAQFIRILAKLLTLVAAVIIFLEGGRNLGIPITTLLAGAGIGGLAIALAAQGTLKDLLGTMMVLLDKPYRVGERIIVKNYDGLVDEIGLRSTKIRLLTGHMVTVPNDIMAQSEIENVGRRPYIRRSSILELPSDTPVVQVRRALEIVRAAMDNHEGMKDDYPPRVFLRDLKEASIGVFFTYWYHPPNYWDYLAFSEHVNLMIMEQLEAEQIPFAAPALTVDISDRGEQPD
jgi:MscS family membrane protein